MFINHNYLFNNQGRTGFIYLVATRRPELLFREGKMGTGEKGGGNQDSIHSASHFSSFTGSKGRASIIP